MEKVTEAGFLFDGILNCLRDKPSKVIFSQEVYNNNINSSTSENKNNGFKYIYY